MLKEVRTQANIGRSRQLLILIMLGCIVLVFVNRVQSDGSGSLQAERPQERGVQFKSDFDLSWWTADSGGSSTGTAEGYNLRGTIGQPDVGTSAAEGYVITGGFWPGLEEREQTHKVHLVWITLQSVVE